MEWVETTARNVEEAKEVLLDRLGVDSAEAEFDILEEPKPGLFGRTKGQARVRARVRPKAPPARDDRRRRSPKKGGNGGSGGDGRGGRNSTSGESAAETSSESADAEPTESTENATAAGKGGGGRRNSGNGRGAPREDRENAEPTGPRLDSEIARTESEAFLRELLDHFGAEATIAIEIDELGDLSAEIAGDGLGRLIGPRGGVITAIEELTRTRLQHVASGGSTPRFKLDIGNYRGSRRSNLEALVDEVVEKVRATGQPHVLDVVVAGERKAVHDRVAEVATDVQTHSEGEDPVRRVVLTLG